MCQKPGSWFFTIVEVLGLSTCLWTAGCWAEVGQIQHVPAGGRSSISFLTCHSALSESPPRTGEALVLGRHQHDNTYCLIAVWWMKSFNETGPNCAGKLPYFCVLNGSDPSATRSISVSASLPMRLPVPPHRALSSARLPSLTSGATGLCTHRPPLYHSALLMPWVSGCVTLCSPLPTSFSLARDAAS